jgi:hypothetical protein
MRDVENLIMKQGCGQFMIIRVLIQFFLIPVILFFIFGFGESFEYPSPNTGQVIYMLLFVLFSIIFIKIAKDRTHKIVSCVIISFTSLLWFLMLIFEIYHYPFLHKIISIAFG